jgi:hypothetical protein
MGWKQSYGMSCIELMGGFFIDLFGDQKKREFSANQFIIVGIKVENRGRIIEMDLINLVTQFRRQVKKSEGLEFLPSGIFTLRLTYLSRSREGNCTAA